LRPRASAGLSDVPPCPGQLGEVARGRVPVVVNDLAGDPAFDREWVARASIAAMAAIPLLSGGEMQGVLVHFARQALSAEVIDVLAAFAAIVAAALNDVESLAREQAARTEAEDQWQKLQTILDILPVGVLLAEGPEGRISLINPAGRMSRIVCSFCHWS